MKTVTKQELEYLARQLIGKDLETAHQSLAAAEEQVKAQVSDIAGKVESLDNLVADRATKEELKSASRRLETSLNEFKIAVTSLFDKLDIKLAHKQKSLESSQETIVRLKNNVNNLKDQSLEIGTLASRNSDHIENLEKKLSQLESSQQRIIKRQAELERISTENHSEAIAKLARSLTGSAVNALLDSESK